MIPPAKFVVHGVTKQNSRFARECVAENLHRRKLETLLKNSWDAIDWGVMRYVPEAAEGIMRYATYLEQQSGAVGRHKSLRTVCTIFGVFYV